MDVVGSCIAYTIPQRLVRFRLIGNDVINVPCVIISRWLLSVGSQSLVTFPLVGGVGNDIHFILCLLWLAVHNHIGKNAARRPEELGQGKDTVINKPGCETIINRLNLDVHFIVLMKSLYGRQVVAQRQRCFHGNNVNNANCV